MGKVIATKQQKGIQERICFEKNVTFFDCDFRGEFNLNYSVIMVWTGHRMNAWLADMNSLCSLAR